MTPQQQPLPMLWLWAAAVLLASPMMRGAAAAAVHLELHPLLGPSALGLLVSRLPRQSAVLLFARRESCEWIQPYDMFAAVEEAAEVPCCTAF